MKYGKNIFTIIHADLQIGDCPLSCIIFEEWERIERGTL
jgi:hypothetical protein